MKVSIHSPFKPYKMHTMDLPITLEQLEEYLQGETADIQKFFPQLNPDQREFLITGIFPGEYPGDEE